MTAKDEAVPGTAKAPGKLVYVDLAYAPGHWPVRGYADISLDERIFLASHKPLGAYLAQRTPEGWRWVPGWHQIGPKMQAVADFVADNPGCCKADAAWGAGLYLHPYFGRWGPIERAIAAGLITAENVYWNRYRLFACGFDRRAYYGEIPAAEPDGYWHPEAHP